MRLEVDTKQLEKNFKALGRQLPYITMLALNDTAFDSKKLIRLKTQKKLNINNQSVLNGFRVKKATKGNLVSQVFVPMTAWQYGVLAQHFAGGDRERKGLEDILRHMGAMTKAQILTPSGGTRITKSGYKRITNAIKQSYGSRYNPNGKTKGIRFKSFFCIFVVLILVMP